MRGADRHVWPVVVPTAPQTKLPGHAAIHQRSGSAKISRLVHDGDPTRLTAWLGSHPAANRWCVQASLPSA